VHHRSLHRVGRDFVPDEPAVLGGIPHEDREGETEREQRQSVENGGDPLRLRVLPDERGHELRWEGEKRDEQQDEQVEAREGRIGGAERTRDRGVLQPDDADRQEARDVGEVCRPLVENRAQKMVGGVGLEAELEDEQRYGDRENAVAEGLQPPERQLVGG
jgi:hypothetical protein